MGLTNLNKMEKNTTVINDILAGEGLTISSLARKLGVSRSKIYNFLKGAASDLLPLLESTYSNYFIGEIKADATTNNTHKETFTAQNQDIIPAQQILVTTTPEKNKYTTPSKFPTHKNLRCSGSKGCYDMKVPVRDLEKAAPVCPVCNSTMLTRSQRKTIGLEY